MSSVTGNLRAGNTRRIASLETREQVAKSANFTVTAAHINVTVHTTKASGITVTLPQDSDDTGIVVGSRGRLYQEAAGQITVANGSGATVHSAGLTLKSLQLATDCSDERRCVLMVPSMLRFCDVKPLIPLFSCNVGV